MVVEAILRLRALPQEYSAAIANFPDLASAGKAVFDIVRYGVASV